jgi:uncharacterized protein YbaR (Trm112 family)
MIDSSDKLRIEVMRCPCCQNVLELVAHGGCGGNGTLLGCETCDAVFHQDTGGLVSTRGGEQYSRMSYTLSGYRARHEEAD